MRVILFPNITSYNTLKTKVDNLLKTDYYKIITADDYVYYRAKDGSLLVYFSNFKVSIASDSSEKHGKNSYTVIHEGLTYSKLKNLINKHNKIVKLTPKDLDVECLQTETPTKKASG